MPIFKKILQIFSIPALFSVLTILFYINIEQTLFTWIIEKFLVILTLGFHAIAFPLFFISHRNKLSFRKSLKQTEKEFLPFWKFFFKELFFLPKTILVLIVIAIFGFFVHSSFHFFTEFSERISAQSTSFFFYAYLFLVSFLLISIFTRKYSYYGDYEKHYLGKIKKVSYALLRVFGFLLFLPAFVLLFNLFFRNYDPPFDDSHLIFEETEVKEEGNLYYFLQGEEYGEICSGVVAVDPKDIEEMEDYSEDFYSFIKDNPEKAKEVVEKNKKVYACFDKMASFSYFISPLKIDYLELNIWPAELMSLARANIFKAAYLFREGRNKEAAELIIKGVKVGNLIASNKNNPMPAEILTGIGVKAITLGGVKQIEDIAFNPNTAREYTDELKKQEIDASIIERVIMHSYMNAHYTIDNFEEYDDMKKYADLLKRPSFYFKPNKTKREYIDYLQGTKTIGYFTYYDYLTALYIEGNIIGKILNYAVAIVIDFSAQQERIHSVNLDNRLVRTFLALSAYEKERGRLPENLEELVPQYLSEIPKDPFYEGEEIRYSKEARIVYSVRKEEVDEGKKKNYIFEF